MNRIRIWTRTTAASFVAVALLGVPQFAAAEQCRNSRYGGDREARYSRNRDYRDNGANYANSYNGGRYGYSDYNGPYRSNDSRYNSYSDYYGNDGYYNQPRSAGQSAAIIGGSAAAGAVVGGLTKGMKGAIIGGAIGGAGGLIYDRVTRNNSRRW